MTSISALRNAPSAYTAYRVTAVAATNRDDQDPLNTLASTLGLTSDELRYELRSGRSLSEIAAARGVSHDDLIAAIKAGLPAASSAGSAEATEIAERIAGTQGLPQQMSPTPPASLPPATKGENSGIQDAAKLADVSRLLGMQSAEVADRAEKASDLVRLFQDRGVNLGRLNTVLTSGDLLDVNA